MFLPQDHADAFPSSAGECQEEPRIASAQAPPNERLSNQYTSGRSLADTASHGRTSPHLLVHSGRRFSAVPPAIAVNPPALLKCGSLPTVPSASACAGLPSLGMLPPSIHIGGVNCALNPEWRVCKGSLRRLWRLR